MLKLNKKGFTVVELVIVIAVVAILAAVLIPTFLTLVQTANVSADIQLVTNLNKIMAMQDALDGRNATMHDALADAAANGYDVTRLTPTSNGNDIVWDQSADRFALVQKAESGSVEILYSKEKEDKKEYAANEVHTLWKIYDEVPAPDEQSYSVYYNGSAELATVEVKVGFDAGKCTGIETLSYVRTNAEAAQDVIFRTNGGTLTVDAKLDTVKHYGMADCVKITAVANESYHEFGMVKGNIEVASGRVVVAEGAKVLGKVLVTGGNVMVDIQNKETGVVAVGDVQAPTVTGAPSGPVQGTVVKTLGELEAAKKNSGYIILGANITITTGDFCFTKDTTLNLGGYTLSGWLSASGSKNTLTIEGNGVIKNDNEANAAVTAKNEATVIINGGTICSADGVMANGQYGAYVIINGGVIEATKHGVYVKSSSVKYPSNIIINGGVIRSETYVGIWVNGVSSAKVTVNNADVTGKEHAVFVRNDGEITINGGVFTSEDNAVVGTRGNKEDDGYKITINGGTFNANIATTGYIACGIYHSNSGELTVNGGTFNITNGVGILVRSGKATIGKDVVINVTGIGQSGKVGQVGGAKTPIPAGCEIVVEYSLSGYAGGIALDNKSAYKEHEINKN